MITTRIDMGTVDIAFSHDGAQDDTRMSSIASVASVAYIVCFVVGAVLFYSNIF